MEIRAVRPVFRREPVYINFLNIEILYFQTLSVDL